MQVFRVMERQSGDTRAEFTKDEAGIAAASERFKELTGKGFFAWAPASDAGPARQIREFDPSANEIVFQPQLKGG